ncbi:MAG: hypothetical protein A3C93_02705 [Candidatus Lloydbacteria bacterium RIFCSPHIGHO2_02_FULL_54_17]|uniref:DOD-type homing endonuclease domain-containing protein n=1 Tax=Candidatus Lloydbacteria bacterium RIFCSPHIGHO2_02_FULL_54_17 TaxID=1798664 RepID=A0A1G2DDA3_9BACT|nr:MAG: hypothetical protein A2762_05955 [Candidatus Lloydbacteria bacterium RIFCSPHIGHO2_01_FULL_54_11]OGZ10931.1 MAG: hypothetical protein A3C93_02705 [Candidatus Lloydbacteria bacterium RIFCSPHIGHO2_02_FULL_54_17]OGZ14912.1 MAG: hypothetical protein A2948_05300 [Candidatus Lloydbacteria bacterium RIFCSPLOWO2_01_FULL_54_18]OGZ15869.1 MAG: hypothetical protein A3H76_06820 [Candidatus Lloydbacteria bacterium RIFCSPLOWO2_02_FULL_54_12]
MAYVLGFFAADGSMLKNSRGAHFIEFHITDREVLVNIKKALASNHKIAKQGRRKGHSALFRIQIGSKEMFGDLRKFGFTQAKSKKMRLPKIPGKYLGDFVRGYFDGDGCVYFKKHKVKDRKRMRWVFSSRFTSGSRGFLLDLHGALRKIVNGGFIMAKKKQQKVSGHELVFSHRDSLALFKFMYNNGTCNHFLKRKYRLFKRAVETLYGVRS